MTAATEDVEALVLVDVVEDDVGLWTTGLSRKKVLRGTFEGSLLLLRMRFSLEIRDTART